MATPPPVYALDAIAFAYDAVPVLRVPSLEIARGEILGVVGANGSGKTTLLHLLGFLASPSEGRLWFLGQEARAASLVRLRRRVGLLLQTPYLFRTSVLANVARGLAIRGLPGREARRRARAALEQVGLAGFETRPAARLSGGEAKRVALARILAFETDVLLLDEPLAHMDQHSARQTEALIARLNRDEGKTIVLASHDQLWVQALAHRVLSLHEGRLVPASLTNVFRGIVSADGSRFETGRIAIQLLAGAARGTHIAIDPTSIVLSETPLTSSMRNTFRGRIVAVSEERGGARVQVEAGERFHVLITKASLDLLHLRLGQEVCLSFKSTSAHLF